MQISTKPLIVMVVFGFLLTIIVIVVNRSGQRVLLQAGRQQVEQEADIVQRRFVEAEETLLADTKVLLNLPDLPEMIISSDKERLKTAILPGLTWFNFNDIEIVDMTGARLFDLHAETSIQEDTLLALALQGIETTGFVIVAEDGASEFRLAAVIPLLDRSGGVIGGVISSRKINEIFLEIITFSRENIELVFIHDGQIWDLGEEESEQHFAAPVEALLLDQTILKQALSGQTIIANDLISVDGVPHTMAHMPLKVSGRPEGVIVILANQKALVIFQKERAANITRIIMILGPTVMIGISFFARQNIIAPIQKLQGVAKRMAGGDYSQRVDMTARDEIGQLAQAFNEMASAVEQRERYLKSLNQDLQQEIAGRQQALAVSRLKSELMAKVSHELRTPLGAILGFTELLQGGFYGPVSEEQIDIMAEVIDSVNYLTNLVNELLEQDQLDSGKLTLNISPFAPKDIIDQMQAKMQVLAQTKGLTLTTSVAADVPAVLSGDENRLQQIVINLVGNAIKFTQRGAVQVCLYRPDPTHWAIRVVDTGPGIPDEAQAYIFDAFRQVDGSITREHGGSGLGLSIVRQLAALMGGQVTLESKVGQGSTFTVLLPLTTVEG